MAGDVVGDADRQRRLDQAAGAAGRHFDDPAQLVVGRRLHDHVWSVFDELGERRRSPPAAGTGRSVQRSRRGRRGRCRGRDRGAAPAQASTDPGGEDLLELVDDEQLRARVVEPSTASRTAVGIGVGDDHGGPPRAGCPAAARCARAARARRAPATTCRCPDAPMTATSPSIQDAGGELGDEPLAADEQVGVLRLVGGEGAVRLAADPRRRRQLVAPGARRDEREHVVEHRRPRRHGRRRWRRSTSPPRRSAGRWRRAPPTPPPPSWPRRAGPPATATIAATPSRRHRRRTTSRASSSSSIAPSDSVCAADGSSRCTLCIAGTEAEGSAITTQHHARRARSHRPAWRSSSS